MHKTIYKKFDNYENNKLHIKTLSDINKNCSIETKLLNGFIMPEIKERNIRKSMPNYKSAMNIYKKEIEMYKLVNPIRQKLDEEKELKDIKYIKERRSREKYKAGFYIKKKKK